MAIFLLVPMRLLPSSLETRKLLFLMLTQGVGMANFPVSPIDNGSAVIGPEVIDDGKRVVALEVEDAAEKDEDEDEVRAGERSRSISALYWSNILVVAGWFDAPDGAPSRVLDGRGWDRTLSV